MIQQQHVFFSVLDLHTHLLPQVLQKENRIHIGPEITGFEFCLFFKKSECLFFCWEWCGVIINPIICRCFGVYETNETNHKRVNDIYDMFLCFCQMIFYSGKDNTRKDAKMRFVNVISNEAIAEWEISCRLMKKPLLRLSLITMMRFLSRASFEMTQKKVASI